MACGTNKKLNHAKVRFAFDYLEDEDAIVDAITICEFYELNDIGVYCLIGFEDDPSTARYRLERVKEWGYWPNAMRYQPLNCLAKNSYVSMGWTEGELRKMMQYYNHLRWYEHIPYEEFVRYPYHEKIQQVSLL